MQQERLKVFLLTHGGSDRLLEILSKNDLVEIKGIVVEKVRQSNRTLKEKIKRSIKYDGWGATLRKFTSHFLNGKSVGEGKLLKTLERQNELEEVAKKLNLPFFYVEKYHSKETKEFLRGMEADLGVLYGTNIIRKSVFEIPRLGSINIHQGLAPLYRGGPTVFWELFNGESQIGITAHFVAPKVDTGDLILQRTLPLEYDFAKYDLDYEQFLTDFRKSLKEPSAQIMAEAIDQIAKDNFKRTKQDITIGKRYRIPTKIEKDQLVSILKKRREAQKKLHNSFA